MPKLDYVTTYNQLLADLAAAQAEMDAAETAYAAALDLRNETTEKYLAVRRIAIEMSQFPEVAADIEVKAQEILATEIAAAQPLPKV